MTRIPFQSTTVQFNKTKINSTLWYNRKKRFQIISFTKCEVTQVVVNNNIRVFIYLKIKRIQLIILAVAFIVSNILILNISF